MLNQPNQSAICPVCSSPDHHELNYGGHFFFNRPMPLVHCEKCGLKYIPQNLTSAEVTSMYDNATYFDTDYAGGAQPHYTESQAANEKKAARVLNFIKKFKSQGKLLEIGCAGGHFLDLARRKYHFDVTGVEMSSDMAAHARSLGLTVFTGEVYGLPKDRGPFDVIYMGDVLEHVPNLREFTDYILNLLNPKGLLVLELPLTYNPTLVGLVVGLKNLVRNRKWEFKNILPSQHQPKLIKSPPYHLLLFNRSSIKEYLRTFHMQPLVIRIYDGEPKPQFAASMYSRLKTLSHKFTDKVFPYYFGDRAIVVAEKSK